MRDEPKARVHAARRRFAAGIVPVRFRDGVPFLLLLRAYRLWDFPKGESETAEDPLATARRELCEETGLESAELRWGPQYCETRPYSRGKVARYYLAVCPEGEVRLGVNPDLGRPEHHEFRWVSLDEASALIPERLRPVLTWATQLLVDAGK